MKTYTIALTLIFTGYIFVTQSQNTNEKPTLNDPKFVQRNTVPANDTPTTALVDFDAYEKLVKIVKEHRKTHMVNAETFKAMSKEDKTVILDTRSDAMYKAKHIKGAIHLDFTEFTLENLENLIPDKTTRILIYCNNNFSDDQIFLATKTSGPALKKPNLSTSQRSQSTDKTIEEKPITLALNIPTYINLYGYGYKNVYELSELLKSFNGPIEFEGTSVR